MDYNKTYEQTFDDWYETNKEALSTRTSESKLSEAYNAGWNAADALVPLITTIIKECPEIMVVPYEDGYAAGIGNQFIQGQSAFVCIARFMHIRATEKNI